MQLIEGVTYKLLDYRMFRPMDHYYDTNLVKHTFPAGPAMATLTIRDPHTGQTATITLESEEKP